jgi:hypothetical protein
MRPRVAVDILRYICNAGFGLASALYFGSARAKDLQ